MTLYLLGFDSKISPNTMYFKFLQAYMKRGFRRFGNKLTLQLYFYVLFPNNWENIENKPKLLLTAHFPFQDCLVAAEFTDICHGISQIFALFGAVNHSIFRSCTGEENPKYLGWSPRNSQ